MDPEVLQIEDESPKEPPRPPGFELNQRGKIVLAVLAVTLVALALWFWPRPETKTTDHSVQSLGDLETRIDHYLKKHKGG